MVIEIKYLSCEISNYGLMRLLAQRELMMMMMRFLTDNDTCFILNIVNGIVIILAEIFKTNGFYTAKYKIFNVKNKI